MVRPQQVLMALELAMALVLLIGAGLLAHSFVRLTSIPPGLIRMACSRCVLPFRRKTYLKGDQQRTFYSQLMERVKALPGVLSAGAVAALPFEGKNVRFAGLLQVEGRPATENAPGRFLQIAQNMVSPGYFNTLRIPLKSGRYLDGRDGATSPETPSSTRHSRDDFFRMKMLLADGFNLAAKLARING